MAVSPNPELMQSMKETTIALHEFTNAVRSMTQSADALKREEIELAVRREVEKVLTQNVSRRTS